MTKCSRLVLSEISKDGLSNMTAHLLFLGALFDARKAQTHDSASCNAIFFVFISWSRGIVVPLYSKS